jgi:phosphatidylinositol alpha-1,6-mannosyltransferase
MYGLQKVVDVSYNGVDTGKFSRRNKSNDLKRSIGSQHVLIFVGAITQGRGLDILLRAVPIIRNSVPELRVVVVGPSYPGPEPILRLRQLAKELGVSDCAKFIEVNSEVLPKYLACAEIGIAELRQHMAYYGSTPLKVLEYMASGCIVVTAKGSVSSHLIRDGFNGILATPGDSDDVARKILSLFSDRKMAKKIRKNARRTVVKTFSWDVIGAKLERKLHEIAKTNL